MSLIKCVIVHIGIDTYLIPQMHVKDLKEADLDDVNYFDKYKIENVEEIWIKEN